MYILVTGGTGFIGRHLIPKLKALGHKPIVLSRNPKKAKKLLGCAVVASLQQIKASTPIQGMINLAGAPIDKRWSKSYKQKLLDSRVGTTEALIALADRLETKPDWFISGSAIGFYGSQGDKPLDESSPPSDGFTHQLCQQWEQTALKMRKHGTRVCLLRTGVVLGHKGGALKRMLPPFRFGLGGRLGNGQQMFSWIAMDDMIRVIEWLMTSQLEGPVNATAPNPVTNLGLTKALGKVLKRPTVFPMPAWVVKLLFGEMGKTLLLEGQKVIPRQLLDHGFRFDYPEIEQALHKAIKGKK